MWFRIFLASWSFGLLALLGWLGSHKSFDPVIFARYSPAYFMILACLAVLLAVSIFAQVPFLYRTLYRLRREIIVMISATFVSLIIAEAAVRSFDPLGVSYFEESTRYQLDKLPDPVLVFKHASNLRTIYQGVEVSTNQLGLRDRGFNRKQAGELRILLLGDSVTFGWGVPIEATFGRRLETILTSRRAYPVKTVNSGVGGYNTVQQYASLKSLADTVDPDMVVLLYVRNDIQSNDPPFNPGAELDLVGKPPPDAIRTLIGKSWLYRLGLFAFRYSRPPRRASFNKAARGVRESMEALEGIARICQDRSIEFVTFFYRSTRESTTIPSVTDDLFAAVSDVGYNHGFPVIDIGPWWGHINMRSISNSTVDRHPNPRGHEILALGMADVLEKMMKNRSDEHGKENHR